MADQPAGADRGVIPRDVAARAVLRATLEAHGIPPRMARLLAIDAAYRIQVNADGSATPLQADGRTPIAPRADGTDASLSVLVGELAEEAGLQVSTGAPRAERAGSGGGVVERFLAEREKERAAARNPLERR